MLALPLYWSPEPTVLGGIALAAVMYTLGVPRQALLRQPALYFWLGLGTFVVALVTPLDAAADRYLASAHMLQHVLITMVGPPLLLAGLPKSLPRLSVFNPLLNPWPAVIVFNAVLLTWHLPALYDATLTSAPLHLLEHLMFIATALLFWWPVVGPGSRGERRLSPLMKIGYLAFAGVPPTVVGIVLAFAPVVIYTFYAAAPRLFPVLSAIVDQQIAGILMFGLGNLIYFVPITVNFVRLMEEHEDAADDALLKSEHLRSERSVRL